MKDTATATPLAFLNEVKGARLPRIALMGEFSAGKSTLANLMIGTDPLPVQVVATQLPPVWISYGSGPSVIVDLEGNETPCDLDAWQGYAPEDIAFIRFYREEEILKRCDIIDMPGISDPNMSGEVWQRIMPLADGVLWCSPSTQAWRQSEAAVWDSVEDDVKANSLLVLTRSDMLLTEKDKAKVLRRVTTQAGALFSGVVMMSLLQAGAVEDDEALWEESGAERFVTAFLTLIERIKTGLSGDEDQDGSQLASPADPSGHLQAAETPMTPDAPMAEGAPVVPRRPVSPRKSRRDSPQAAPDCDTTQQDPLSFMPKFS
ncbi:dynamin family protein [Roseobacter weihaiensis]|uniref:dynamin family protein n=1 Tax=Roseobacter weihaiensis TaxID=2763262 RepID=UPI001D0B1E3E|nr:dynamin family protein [Roseobacter sp. H9]